MKEQVKVGITKEAYEQLQCVDFYDVDVRIKGLRCELSSDGKTEKDHCALLDIELPQEENKMNIDKVETQTPEEKESNSDYCERMFWEYDKELLGCDSTRMLFKKYLSLAIIFGKNETQTEHQEEMSAFSGEVEWSGEGLPPVGAECEAVFVEHEHKGYGKFLVLGYHSNYVWMEYIGDLGNKSKHYTAKIDLVKFRKPETPQQREDRERLDCIKKMYRDGNVDGAEGDLLFFSIEGILANLYDAGYRKGVK